MLEGLGIQSNSVYPLLKIESSGQNSTIVTRSPSKLGPLSTMNGVQNPSLSYSEFGKTRNSQNFRIPKQNLKNLISTIYVNYFRPNYVHTTLVTRFKPSMISGFNLRFS
jgi:hypothetical protein